jgi:hypothetical protein
MVTVWQQVLRQLGRLQVRTEYIFAFIYIAGGENTLLWGVGLG